MLTYEDILNLEKGLAVRTKINNTFRLLISGNEGVNALWKSITDMLSKMDTSFEKTEETLFTLKTQILRAFDHTDTEVASLKAYVDALESGLGGFIPETSYNPEIAENKSYTFIAVGAGTYIHFLTQDGNPIVITDDNTLNIFYKGEDVPYWSVKSLSSFLIKEAIDGGDASTLKTRIQLRRDDKSGWETENPVLKYGELTYEGDTRKMKVGDGYSPYSLLPYFLPKFVQEATLERPSEDKSRAYFFNNGSITEVTTDNSIGAKVIVFNQNTYFRLNLVESNIIIPSAIYAWGDFGLSPNNHQLVNASAGTRALLFVSFYEGYMLKGYRITIDYTATNGLIEAPSSDNYLVTDKDNSGAKTFTVEFVKDMTQFFSVNVPRATYIKSITIQGVAPAMYQNLVITDQDNKKLSVRIDDVSEGHVAYSIIQSLTEEQKKIARTNIGVPDEIVDKSITSSKLADGAVRLINLARETEVATVRNINITDLNILTEDILKAQIANNELRGGSRWNVIGQNGYIDGILDMFSDSGAHVLYQIYTTSTVLKDGDFIQSPHVHGYIYQYIRYYNISDINIPRGWTAWKLFTPNVSPTPTPESTLEAYIMRNIKSFVDYADDSSGIVGNIQYCKVNSISAPKGIANVTFYVISDEFSGCFEIRSHATNEGLVVGYGYMSPIPFPAQDDWGEGNNIGQFTVDIPIVLPTEPLKAPWYVYSEVITPYILDGAVSFEKLDSKLQQKLSDNPANVTVLKEQKETTIYSQNYTNVGNIDTLPTDIIQVNGENFKRLISGHNSNPDVRVYATGTWIYHENSTASGLYNYSSGPRSLYLYLPPTPVTAQGEPDVTLEIYTDNPEGITFTTASGDDLRQITVAANRITVKGLTANIIVSVPRYTHISKIVFHVDYVRSTVEVRTEGGHVYQIPTTGEGSVNRYMIEPNAVDSGRLAEGAVTPTKIEPNFLRQITNSNITVNDINNPSTIPAGLYNIINDQGLNCGIIFIGINKSIGANSALVKEMYIGEYDPNNDFKYILTKGHCYRIWYRQAYNTASTFGGKWVKTKIDPEAIENNAITSEKIADNSIINAKIASKAVSLEKLSTNLQKRFNEVASSGVLAYSDPFVIDISNNNITVSFNGYPNFVITIYTNGLQSQEDEIIKLSVPNTEYQITIPDEHYVVLGYEQGGIQWFSYEDIAFVGITDIYPLLIFNPSARLVGGLLCSQYSYTELLSKKLEIEDLRATFIDYIDNLQQQINDLKMQIAGS